LKAFRNPLKEALENRKPILSAQQLRVLFPDPLEVILNYNRAFLDELEPLVKRWDNETCIGQVFLQFAMFTRVYTQYVKDLPKSQHLYEQLKTHTAFTQFLMQCRQYPETANLELDALLILPVQRIPRYKLLLEQLIKNTSDTHPDFKGLSKALQKMHEAANYINERKREYDSITKILDIQSKLIGRFESLVDPTRRFLKEGELTAIVPKHQPKEKHFFLFNDIFLCCTEAKGSFRVNGRLLLSSITVELESRQQGLEAWATSSLEDFKKNSFVILDENQILVLTLCGDNCEERDEWFNTIRATQESLQNNNKKKTAQLNLVLDVAPTTLALE